MHKNIKLALLALGLGGIAASACAEDLMQIYQQARQADPTLATAVEDWPVKTSATPQTTKLNASAPISRLATNDLEMRWNQSIMEAVLRSGEKAADDKKGCRFRQAALLA